MAIEGTLDLFQLPEILQVIAQQDKTGILTVQGEADIIAISFQDGLVVAADSLNQTLEEALGGVLASQGLVSPADFETVAAEHQSGGGRLIDLLVSRGVVSREELLDAVRQHTYRLVAELLGWRAGEFKFYSGDEVSFEEGLRPLSVEELLFRSVEEASGEGSPTIPDSWSRYEEVPVDKPIRVRNEGEDPAENEGDAIWITPGESLVLEHLGMADTVTGLVGATGTDEYKVRYGLHRLLELGVARRSGPREDSAVVPPPAEAEEPLEDAKAPSSLDEAVLDPAPVSAPEMPAVEMPELDLDDSAVSSSIPKVKRKLAAGLFQWLGRELPRHLRDRGADRRIIEVELRHLDGRHLRSADRSGASRTALVARRGGSRPRSGQRSGDAGRRDAGARPR